MESMSDLDGRNTEELAYRLWERQGRPQNRSVQNWLEAEYLTHPPALGHRPMDMDGEIDLRMRGLGPLTQPEPSVPNGAKVKGAGPQPDKKQGLWLLSCLAGVSLVMGAGMIFSFSNRRRLRDA
jgi:Protein of unknown function (DUF2934)